MKLLLTSAGWLNKKIADVFINELGVKPKDAKIFMVTGAQTAEEQHYIDESKNEINEVGIEDIDVYKLNRNIEPGELNKYSAVYVCGGNTYFIYSQMQKHGLDKALIDFVKNGGLYFGVSAGSVIPGPSIEISGWGREGDYNKVGLKDLTGLKLVDFSIFPHFKPELQHEVEEFQKKIDYKVVTLTDQEAILVKNNKKIFIKGR